MGAEEEQTRPTAYACDFRTSGLLSNESTRQLRGLHEGFARSFAHALDLFLGAPLEVKLLKIEQQGVREFTGALGSGSYLIPLALQPIGERALARFDTALFFPFLDILLGGSGEQSSEVRELTEIDEELFRSLLELMCTQLERVWKNLNVSVLAQPSVKNLLNSQLFATEDRVVVLHFEIRLGETVTAFTLILPGQFAGAILRGGQTDEHHRLAPTNSQERLRGRVMDCCMSVTATLSGLQVPISELVTMQVGSLLNLRATTQAPVHLQIGNYPLFDVTPVRRGNKKAAQVKAGTPGAQELQA